MTRDPINMVVHTIFPNYFDEGGNYIGEPFTKAEEEELKKTLTSEIGEKEANKAIKSMKKAIKEEHEMATNMISKEKKEKFSLTIGKDTLSVEKAIIPVGDSCWYEGKRVYFSLNGSSLFETKFVAVKTFTNKEGKDVSFVIGEVDPEKDWTTQVTELWTKDHKRLLEKKASLKK